MRTITLVVLLLNDHGEKRVRVNGQLHSVGEVLSVH